MILILSGQILGFIFTSSIRHILSSEISNSTILFCIFIRFSQHFSGLVISGVWNCPPITGRSSLSHLWSSLDEAAPCLRVSVLSDKECHSLPARAPCSAPAPLSSPRTLYCSVLYCTILYTLHHCTHYTAAVLSLSSPTASRESYQSHDYLLFLLDCQ